jgi:aspartate/methionine/tyrosine aminotransferase
MAGSVPGASPGLFAERVSRIGTEEAFKLGPLLREVEADGRRVIRCNLGQPDFPLPAHITEAVVAALRAGHTTYCDPQGLPELREAIATAVGRDRGLDVDPRRVVVYPGSRPSIGLTQHAYVRAGDEVVYPTPGYPLYESFVDYVGGTPVPVPLHEDTGFALTGDELAPHLSARTRLVYLNFPSNPTGGVASPEQLADIARVILEATPPTTRVYSDEAYEAITFDGTRHASIASVPGMAERTIIASAVSKTYSWTGGRVGWAVFPTVEEALVQRNLNINYYASIPPYSQLGAKVALESPESPPAIAAMVEAFQRRRDFVIDGLNRIPGVRCQMPRGAFYAFPNISGVVAALGGEEAWRGLPDEVRRRSSPSTLVALFLLYRYRVATMDRRSFGVRGSEGQHFLRLSVATGDDDLREALRRLEQAAADPKGFADFVRSGERLAY